MCLNIGDRIMVHAYKHNGKLYRTWNNSVVLFFDNDQLLLVNEKVIVTEINGRQWRTKENEPAIWYFHKQCWSNIICMFKDTGLNYYCNIASPFVIDDKVLKYIDYDVDIKVYADNSYKILDLKEFSRHRKLWNYPDKINEQVWAEVKKLKWQINNSENFFNRANVRKAWNYYIEYIKKEKLNKNKKSS